ncbi:hypothetical protein HK101_009669 [Irineochytrium annulatum]|nr:hypothetical protein HK101_009669 [Irineochytrium annulatum]
MGSNFVPNDNGPEPGGTRMPAQGSTPATAATLTVNPPVTASGGSDASSQTSDDAPPFWMKFGPAERSSWLANHPHTWGGKDVGTWVPDAMFDNAAGAGAGSNPVGNSQGFGGIAGSPEPAPVGASAGPTAFGQAPNGAAGKPVGPSGSHLSPTGGSGNGGGPAGGSAGGQAGAMNGGSGGSGASKSVIAAAGVGIVACLAVAGLVGAAAVRRRASGSVKQSMMDVENLGVSSFRDDDAAGPRRGSESTLIADEPASPSTPSTAVDVDFMELAFTPSPVSRRPSDITKLGLVELAFGVPPPLIQLPSNAARLNLPKPSTPTPRIYLSPPASTSSSPQSSLNHSTNRTLIPPSFSADSSPSHSPTSTKPPCAHNIQPLITRLKQAANGRLAVVLFPSTTLTPTISPASSPSSQTTTLTPTIPADMLHMPSPPRACLRRDIGTVSDARMEALQPSDEDVLGAREFVIEDGPQRVGGPSIDSARSWALQRPGGASIDSARSWATAASSASMGWMTKVVGVFKGRGGKRAVGVRVEVDAGANAGLYGPGSAVSVGTEEGGWGKGTVERVVGKRGSLLTIEVVLEEEEDGASSIDKLDCDVGDGESTIGSEQSLSRYLTMGPSISISSLDIQPVRPALPGGGWYYHKRDRSRTGGCSHYRPPSPVRRVHRRIRPGLRVIDLALGLRSHFPSPNFSIMIAVAALVAAITAVASGQTAAPIACEICFLNASLLAGQHLSSSAVNAIVNTHQETLYLQPDGNLVLYRHGGYGPNFSYWSSGTANHAHQTGTFTLEMRTQGDLVVVNAATNAIIWTTKTTGESNCATLRRDGNLVVYDRHCGMLWSSGAVDKSEEPSWLIPPALPTSSIWDGSPTPSPATPALTPALASKPSSTTTKPSTSHPSTARHTSTSIKPPTAPSVAPAASGLAPSDALTPHNAARRATGYAMPDLTWDATVASAAASYAASLASTCSLRHSGVSGQGENLYMSGGSGTASFEAATKAWVDEGLQGSHFNHYTQVVWDTTLRLGCGEAMGKGCSVVVCRYVPPGNYIGEAPYPGAPVLTWN